LVSTAAVKLLSRQEQNIKLDKVKNILIAGDLYSEGDDIAKIYDEQIEPVIIEISSGNVLSEDKFDELLNFETFDIKTVADNQQYGTAIPQGEDIADIKRRPKYMLVYLVMKTDELDRVILPVYGQGLWSTMYAFLALDSELKNVTGVTFYSHGETPGLGGEIENPRWNQIWKGKEAFDDQGNTQLEIIKGMVDPNKPEAKHQVDGLSGATITTRGVDLMIKYWLSDKGYGPFINKLREDV
jgi:Na+-transporting NADH:ubiquinone oxidoreductase subunit C